MRSSFALSLGPPIGGQAKGTQFLGATGYLIRQSKGDTRKSERRQLGANFLASRGQLMAASVKSCHLAIKWQMTEGGSRAAGAER